MSTAMIILTVALSLGHARWMTPRVASIRLRVLSVIASLAIASSVGAWVAAFASLQRLSTGQRSALVRQEGQRIERPTREDLQSLRGAPAEPPCEVVSEQPPRACNESDSGWCQSTVRRCGLALFSVEEQIADYHSEPGPHERPAPDWQFSGWRCRGLSAFDPSQRPPQRLQDLHRRASADGTFEEYTCASRRSVLCCDGSLEPMEPLRPAPARLYVRRRDLRPPIAVATCVMALFGVIASLGLRRSGAGLASPAGVAIPGEPYRAPRLADENAAKAVRRHAVRLLAVVGLLAVAQLLCGVAVARWAQIVR